MVLFHGGCHGCTQQDIHSTDFCIKCKYFNADWSLQDLNNRPLDEAEIERERLKQKYGIK